MRPGASAALEALLEATRRLIEPGSRQRAELIRRLTLGTGLSRAGVEAALSRHLELSPAPDEIMQLGRSVAPAPRAHVILPSNVFVAAHRAIALGLAAAPRVFVKPSRREPVWVDALLAVQPALFERVSELQVEPGDHVFAYGSDTTLEALRRELPAGAVLHAHGAGFGVAVVDLSRARAGSASALDEIAEQITVDVIAFEQRGCLSPRLVLALGEHALALELAQALSRALERAEGVVPRGTLDAFELAEARWHRQCAACFGTVLPAGKGHVSVRDASTEAPPDATSAFQLIPPPGRHLEVVCVQDLRGVLSALVPWLTSAGCSDPEIARELAMLMPRARVCRLGQMQSPPFDGPADRRPDRAGEVIGGAHICSPRAGALSLSS